MRLTPSLRKSILDLIVGGNVRIADIARSHNTSVSTVQRIKRKFDAENEAYLAGLRHGEIEILSAPPDRENTNG